jgi:hypothetical protein
MGRIPQFQGKRPVFEVDLNIRTGGMRVKKFDRLPRFVVFRS